MKNSAWKKKFLSKGFLRLGNETCSLSQLNPFIESFEKIFLMILKEFS